MNACCPEFTTQGFSSRRKEVGVIHVCNSCKRNVTRTVLDMFFADPFGTVKLKIKKSGGSK